MQLKIILNDENTQATKLNAETLNCPHNEMKLKQNNNDNNTKFIYHRNAVMQLQRRLRLKIL